MKKAAKSKGGEAIAVTEKQPAVDVNERGLPEHFRHYFWDLATAKWKLATGLIMRSI
jgi:hypothetical protein